MTDPLPPKRDPLAESAKSESFYSASGAFPIEISSEAKADADAAAASMSTSSSSNSISSEGVPADGEYGVLLKSLEEEESEPLYKDLKRSISASLHGLSSDAIYGHPLSIEEAEKRIPPDSHEGLSWNATIIPDEFFVDGKLKRGLNKRDFDGLRKIIKPRRPSLPVTASDFFSSLTAVDYGLTGKRYIFYGVLNGWPSLRCFEVILFEQRKKSGSLPTAQELMGGGWTVTWKADVEGAKGIGPQILDNHRVYRAKLRGAPWTALGWSKDSPGYAFWYEAQRPEGSRLSYGTNMLKTVSDEKCTYVHMLSHRYAVARESPRDRLTYHSAVLLEWEHGMYCTVVEAAYLNGMGGYKGQCNWYDDRDDGPTALYKAFPPEMISPWRTTHLEIRCYDVKAKDVDEFEQYVWKYEGNTKRFIDPQITFSHAARLTFRSKPHIAQYLLNYVTRDSSYGELQRNCQTFAADLCSFIAGKKKLAPFHPVSRIDYQNRTYLFLYDSHMYESKIKKKLLKR